MRIENSGDNIKIGLFEKFVYWNQLRFNHLYEYFKLVFYRKNENLSLQSKGKSHISSSPSIALNFLAPSYGKSSFGPQNRANRELSFWSNTWTLSNAQFRWYSIPKPKVWLNWSWSVFWLETSIRWINCRYWYKKFRNIYNIWVHIFSYPKTISHICVFIRSNRDFSGVRIEILHTRWIAHLRDWETSRCGPNVPFFWLIQISPFSCNLKML